MSVYNTLPAKKKKEKSLPPPSIPASYTPPKPLGLETVPNVPAFRMPSNTLGFGGMQDLTRAIADYGAGLANALNVARRNQQITNARKTLASLGISNSEIEKNIMETAKRRRELQEAPIRLQMAQDLNNANVSDTNARTGYYNAQTGAVNQKIAENTDTYPIREQGLEAKTENEQLQNEQTKRLMPLVYQSYINADKEGKAKIAGELVKYGLIPGVETAAPILQEKLGGSLDDARKYYFETYAPSLISNLLKSIETANTSPTNSTGTTTFPTRNTTTGSVPPGLPDAFWGRSK